MADIEALLQRVAEGDEEAITELRTAYAAKDADVQRERGKLALEQKLLKDKELRDRYPRAIRAYEKGRLGLPEDGAEETLLKSLQSKEEELAELGVPVETHQPSPPSATPPTEASGFGKPIGPQSPGSVGRNLLEEYLDARKGTTIHDQAKAHQILIEMNQQARHDPKMRDDIARLSEITSAPPIILNGI
jgi:hypothetical protein